MKPMLAVAADLSKVRYPVYAQPKLDGIRCVVKDGVLLSRTLKPIRNVHCQNLFGHLHGLDGELIVGDPCAPDVFQKSTSGVMSSKGTPDVTFHVFDRWDVPGAPYSERRSLAWKIITESGLPSDRILRVHSTLVNSQAELETLLEKYIAKGYEGLILRAPDSAYKYGRSTVNQGYLLKIKLFEDAEFQVVGFKELMHNTNEATTNELGRTKRSSHKENLVPSGMLGALIVGYEGATTDVGTGFSMEQRKEIFANKEKYLGAWAKVRYQTIGMKDLPRFGSFQGFRDPDDMS